MAFFINLPSSYNLEFQILNFKFEVQTVFSKHLIQKASP